MYANIITYIYGATLAAWQILAPTITLSVSFFYPEHLSYPLSGVGLFSLRRRTSCLWRWSPQKRQPINLAHVEPGRPWWLGTCLAQHKGVDQTPKQPPAKKKKQTSNLLGFCNWAKLGIQKFLTCWGLDWYQKCKEDQPLKSKQIKHTASTFNSAARLFAKPKKQNSPCSNILLYHLLQFSCFTNTSA